MGGRSSSDASHRNTGEASRNGTPTGLAVNPSRDTSGAIQLESIDLQQSTNATAHRTISYMSKELIVRRGQTFTMNLTFNKPAQTSDNLKLNISTGSINIDLPIQIPSQGDGATWSASCTQKSNTLIVKLNSPVNAVIGCYTMTISFSSGGSNTSKSLGNVYVLFNPWVKGDAVYLENEAEKNEYVLNETGVIFYGSASTLRARPWDFGQCEDDILNITLKILDSSIDYKRDPKKEVTLRHDPVHVARVLSAMINSQNDNGVIVGNWSADYTGGERPTKWNGSTDILRQWKNNGPVRFGQCWVYAGVLCTVLRCLGIPTRVITNFASAHDTDQSLTIDRYFDKDGVESEETADSIWNFHVWNESWFVRSDIGSDYDGWQVLDATPQEPSKGLYRLGPCSVKAIKEGEVDLDYDAPFVFSEMNADVIDWLISPDNSKKKISSNTRSVGRLTSTKAINSDERVDVTGNYKYAEGSTKEREIFTKAKNKLASTESDLRRSTVAFSADEPAPKPDFTGNFKYSNDIEVGHDVTFSLCLQNTSANEMTLQANLTASAIVYTNALVKDILTNTQSVKLGPNEEKSIPYTIPYTEYENAITADNMIKVMAVCEDEKKGNLLVQAVIILKNPPIKIKITEKAQLNKSLTVEITVTNPTPDEAQNCVMTIQGSGLVKEQSTIQVPQLSKNQISVSKVNILPYRIGQRCLMVDFSSDKFSDVKGSLVINVASS
ncbi:protein-glutamine gamma-glutamyltransferase E-like isoform X1 [Bufo bufo]|uniref:protein-glutamine gamma-glutamyltransferase E-like isoform X1 n=1 Tax=Bufo bufo TaxID=8384 RepID=UPI001ABE48E5|nr:protein-glutamine gamma-glutamyltransferase E-like isoform X1 [Bufo bufo]